MSGASLPPQPSPARVCRRCGNSRDTPSPLRSAGFIKREWCDGRTCALCDELESIVGGNDAAASSSSSSGSSVAFEQDWHLMLQAYLSLRLEDAAEITAKLVLERSGVLMAISTMTHQATSAKVAEAPSVPLAASPRRRISSKASLQTGGGGPCSAVAQTSASDSSSATTKVPAQSSSQDQEDPVARRISGFCFLLPHVSLESDLAYQQTGRAIS